MNVIQTTPYATCDAHCQYGKHQNAFCASFVDFCARITTFLVFVFLNIELEMKRVMSGK